MKNQEGCVNTLSMECMDFYYRSSNNTQNQNVSNICRYGRDGANYTSRAIFDCYYNEHDNSSVVLDYQPQRLHNTQIFCNNHHHIISELFSSCCSGAWSPGRSCLSVVSTCVSAASSCSLVMMVTWGSSAVARLSQASERLQSTNHHSRQNLKS